MAKQDVIAHELGHAICAETQDGYWYSTSLGFEKDDNALAYCYCDKHETKKTNIQGPATKIKQAMNLGGIFGELLCVGNWSPWGARCDVDELCTANQKSKLPIVLELHNWIWVDDDELSMRACSKLNTIVERRNFVLDSHDTARRLPELWSLYMDFCDRIHKDNFRVNVIEISKSRAVTIEQAALNKIFKDVIL
jgi:hypothetical protein